MKSQPKSIKPRKQRKWRITAPTHKRRKIVSSTLSKSLRSRHNRRSIPVRKGDVVKVLRGDYAGVTGEVVRVDARKYKVYVEGVTLKKSDGTDIEEAVDPSNLQITELMVDDIMRRKVLERKAGKADEKTPKKPATKSSKKSEG